MSFGYSGSLAEVMCEHVTGVMEDEVLRKLLIVVMARRKVQEIKSGDSMVMENPLYPSHDEICIERKIYMGQEDFIYTQSMV